MKDLPSGAPPAGDQLSHLREEQAETLKERIYATLALLAVMVSLRSESVTPFGAITEIGGTALSLWAASILATGMAYRVVHGRLMGRAAFGRMVRVHAPLLAAAIPTIVTMLLAVMHVLSVKHALAAAIGLEVFVLVIWSLVSARAMHTSRQAALVITALEVGFGLAVVALKLAVGK